MTVEEANKQLIRYYVEHIFNRAAWNCLGEIVDPNYIVHSSVPGLPQGIEGFRIVVGALHAGFPDVQNKIDDIFAEGDRVVTRWTARGTHLGEFFGIPPTGKRVKVTGISIDRIENGKWVEGWAEYDQFGMLQQLGVIPAPGPTAG